MPVSRRRSSASSTRTATTCGASWSPRSGATPPTTASRRPSSPRCAPIRACAPTQPAGVGADHRPPQGAGPPPRPRPPGGAVGDDAARRRGAAGPRAAATTASGRASARCRPSSAPRCCCASPATSATAEVAAALGCSRRPRAARPTRGCASLRRGDDADAMTASALAPVRPRRRRGGRRALRRHRAGRRRLRARRHARRARSSPRGTARGLARLAYEDHAAAPTRVLDWLAGTALPAHPRGAGAAGRRAPRARRVLRRAAAPPSTCRSTGRSSTPLRPPRPARDRGASRSARRRPTARSPRPAGNPQGLARGGQRARRQPDPDRRALPPRPRAGGALGGYTGGLHRKEALLRDRGRRPPRLPAPRGLLRLPAPTSPSPAGERR